MAAQDLQARKAALDARFKELERDTASFYKHVETMEPLVAARAAEVLADRKAGLADDYEAWIEEKNRESQ